ncbi:MAG: hypothetical protein SOY02_05610 [Candidatus Onthovivens sp.]|nr:hypothetical protein [Candidatus Onthovivens sp.]
MIKQSVINFFRNLKYFFTPLGTLFLGLIFGVSFLYSGFKVQVKQATTEIQMITQETNISINDLKDCVIESFADVPWEDPIEAIKLITSSEWLNGTLKENISNTIDNYQLYASDIENAVVNAVSGYIKYIVIFVICAMVGFISGFFLTKFLIRRNIAKRNFWKFILVTMLDSVLTIGVATLSMWLTLLWKPSIIFTSLVGIIIYGFISLFEAYIIHGYKKIPLKQVVNIKNSFLLFISNILIYIISFTISSFVIAITNAFVGVFIALPLVIVGIIVISLNAEAYIKKQVDKI